MEAVNDQTCQVNGEEARQHDEQEEARPNFYQRDRIVSVRKSANRKGACFGAA